MSFDRRIRHELERAAELVDADIERNLGAVEARARMRRGSAPTLILAATMTIVALALVRVVPATTPGIEVGASLKANGPSASASSPAEQAIAGTWLVSLPASNTEVQRDGVSGDWTLRLRPDGVALLSAPTGFAGGAGSLSGITFSVSGDQFRTDLFYNDFCSSIGTYVWARSGGRLTLTPVADDCAKRRTLLATTHWIEAP
jgi:hypothetical protein